MDLTAALGAPFKDPDWLKKCAVAGVIAFLPLVGLLAHLGWLERWYRARIDGGAVLPEPTADLGGDIGRGFRFMLASIASFLPFFVVTGAAGVAAALSGALLEGEAGAIVSVLGTLVFTALILVMSVGMAVSLPAVVHQHVVRGRTWVWSGFGEMSARIRSAPTAVLLVVVGMMLANTVAQLGVIACFVGVIVTSAIGQAMTFALYAEWAKATEGAAPPTMMGSDSTE
jgi:hypothetical protein